MPIATHERTRASIGLGTFVTVQTQADRATAADAGVAAAFAAVARVERLMHPSRAGSDVHAIRQSVPGKTVGVDPWTYEVLSLCARLHAATGGAFDPCLPGAGRLADLQLHAGSDRDPPRVTVHATVHLDLGGVGKGFAIDRAVDGLKTAGCSAGLVNCGGDLALFGSRPQRIACTAHAGRAVWVELENGALAASDTASASRPSEHCGYYNRVDPCARVDGRVFVVAPTAMLADALTKCVLIGVGDVAALLAQFGARQLMLEDCQR